MQGKTIGVIGGSGFVGRSLVRDLALAGARVKAGARNAEAAKFLRTMGAVGQVTPMRVDLVDGTGVLDLVQGCDAVINLVGILFPSGANTFSSAHVSGAATAARASAKAGVGRFIQVSALGASAGSASSYARTKAAGEEAVQAEFPGATIVRPSVVFGPDDSFFNRFGAMAAISPVLPVIGGGRSRFQPVYVDDVARAMMNALSTPASAGKTYELGGPEVFDFRELMHLVNAHAKRDRALVSIPAWFASFEAFFLEFLPRPPLTRDQIALLGQDNVASEGALTLADLGVEGTACEVILPRYLDRFRPGGAYNRSRVTV